MHLLTHFGFGWSRTQLWDTLQCKYLQCLCFALHFIINDESICCFLFCLLIYFLCYIFVGCTESFPLPFICGGQKPSSPIFAPRQTPSHGRRKPCCNMESLRQMCRFPWMVTYFFPFLFRSSGESRQRHAQAMHLTTLSFLMAGGKSYKPLPTKNVQMMQSCFKWCMGDFLAQRHSWVTLKLNLILNARLCISVILADFLI